VLLGDPLYVHGAVPSEETLSEAAWVLKEP
jgi:hypothetical protein